MNNKTVNKATKQTENNPGVKSQRKRNKKQKQKRSKSDSSNNQVPESARNRSLILSKCSDTYLKCLMNPFDSTIKGACVPDLNATPSTKLTFLTRGTVTVGSAGTAWVAFNPWFPGSNVDCIAWTDGSHYAGSGFDMAVAIPPTYFSSPQFQCPYSGSSFVEGGGTMAYRVVGAGLRVRYQGAEIYRSGQLVPFRHPDNGSINALTVAQILAFNEIKTYPANRRWHEMAWAPMSLVYNQTTFGGFEYVGGFTSGFLPWEEPNTIGICIENCAIGAGIPNATFEWEAIGHYEFVGNTFGTSPSHSDLTGMTAIRNIQGGAMNPVSSEASYKEAKREVESSPAIDWMSIVTTGVGIASMFI